MKFFNRDKQSGKKAKPKKGLNASARPQKKKARGAVRSVDAQTTGQRFEGAKRSLVSGFSFLKGPRFFMALLLCVAVSALVFSLTGLNSVKEKFVIEVVQVQGEFSQIKQQDLEESLSALVGTNYFDLKIAGLRKSALSNAWVESVNVRRIWPATVSIEIVERRAIARWGKNGLVGENGELFFPNKTDFKALPEMPDLFGVRSQSDKVLSNYAEMATRTRQQGLVVNRFALVAGSFWQIGFKQGFDLFLDVENGLESMELFLAIYEKEIAKQIDVLEKVDMRYSNGLSIFLSEDKKDLMKLGLVPEDAMEVSAVSKVKQPINEDVRDKQLGNHHG